MKKTILIALAVVAMIFTSCEDFLDTENYWSKDSSNFPKTENDVSQMIAAVYQASFYEPFANNDVGQYWTWANLSADDMYGGGGSDDAPTQALDHLLWNKNDQMNSLWSAAYKAIARANAALSYIDNVQDEEVRNQSKGELLFMRAFNYFDLAKCFGNIPMVEKAPENVAEAQIAPDQVKPEVVFVKIASDLKLACDIMPDYKYDNWTAVPYGKATKWAAEALLGRVFLFYTGFFKQSDMTLEDGSKLTKDQVIAYIDDCVNNSGFGLLEDYRSLWPYANEWTAKDYDFVSDLNQKWQAGNKEVLFGINYLYMSEWGSGLKLSNQYSLFFGIRHSDWDGAKIYTKDADVNCYPFGTGWGCGPVSPVFYDEWKQSEPNDKRREASVLEFPSAWDWSTTSNWMEATGLHQKKTVAVRSGGGDISENGTGFASFCAEASWGGAGASKGHYQVSHCQTFPLIRFADVLLMQSELKEDAAGINAVRQRAGLSNVAYSLKALQDERRWELAFEGYRWDDMRRWGIAPECLDKQVGGAIHNDGVATTMKAQGGNYSARYAATNGGFYRIPGDEVANSNGAIVQNPGWSGQEGYYGSWQE